VETRGRYALIQRVANTTGDLGGRRRTSVRSTEKPGVDSSILSLGTTMGAPQRAIGWKAKRSRRPSDVLLESEISDAYAEGLRKSPAVEKTWQRVASLPCLYRAHRGSHHLR
jgi:hypothetical protein